MKIQWRYIDEEIWNDYIEGVGIESPRTNFIVRVIRDDGDSDLDDDEENVVALVPVNVCGEVYLASIDFIIIDNANEKKYRPIINGIPEEEIESIEWRVQEFIIGEPDLGDSDYEIIDFGESDLRDAEDVRTVCVSAIVQLKCGCDTYELDKVCYTFTEDQVNCNELGLDMELEDGCWKPVRTGIIECCVAMDIILWKIK